MLLLTLSYVSLKYVFLTAWDPVPVQTELVCRRHSVQSYSDTLVPEDYWLGTPCPWSQTPVCVWMTASGGCSTTHLLTLDTHYVTTAGGEV